MKNYIYIFAALLLGLLSSCDDFLTQKSPDQLTTDTFWRDLEDAESAISSAYSQLENSTNTWDYAEIKWPVEAYREDVVILGNDAMNYPNWVELSNFNYTNGNSQFLYYWRNNYTGVSFTNQIIEKIEQISSDKISGEQRAQIKGEAHFLRAYYHLKNILNWKDIIIRDKYITSPSELDKATSPRIMAWDFIVSDLKKALDLPISYDGENIGRATSGAAYSYLGFVYLTRAYEEVDKKQEYLELAIEAFNKVTGYELEENFKSMFNGENKNCKESIFELQFTMNNANGADYTTQAHKWIAASELGGWDEIIPSERLVNELKKEGEIGKNGMYDKRLYHTIFCDLPYFNDGTGKVFGSDYKDLFKTAVLGPDGKPTGDFEYYDRPVFHKLLPATKEKMDKNDSAINLPLMRYANVLLLKAEALNELNRTAEAIPLINEVRAKHGDMPPMVGTTYDDVKKQIEHERIIEFPLENWRWYDLRRWGKLEEAMKSSGRPNFKLDQHAFYPIPLSEIYSNNAVK